MSHVYEVGGEKRKLEVAFESVNTNRFEQELNEVLIEYHNSKLCYCMLVFWPCQLMMTVHMRKCC